MTVPEEEIIARRAIDVIISQRLSGIEAQLLKLVDVMERQSRVDERLAISIEKEAETSRKLIDLDSRLRSIEINNAGNNKSLGTIERLIWAGVAAVLAFVGNWFHR